MIQQNLNFLKPLSNLLTRRNTIHVTETSMQQIIKRYRHNNSVTFAHSISNDFYEPRHMSAGEAFVFKNLFWKSQPTQRLTPYMTLQGGQTSASIYRLITKASYFEKLKMMTPLFVIWLRISRRETWNTWSARLWAAHMTKSACFFVNNIFKFQWATKSSVTKVSYFHRAHRFLRNRLSHEDFISQFRDLIK